MKRITYLILFFILILFTPFLFQSCKDDQPEMEEEETETLVEVVKFAFLKKNNPTLPQDYIGDILEDRIIIKCAGLENFDGIIPIFEGNFDEVYVDSNEQLSGSTPQNFTDPVTYTFVSTNTIKKYTVFVEGYNLIPLVIINTENNVPVESKTENIKAEIIIKNDSEREIIRDNGKIKGRGNATWNYDKKPYKVKFSEKKSPFGFAENKDWVLLAEANDYSMLRTSYMCEVSKSLEMPYTVDFRYVDLYLNGEYRGIYIFTEKVEEGKHRVNLDTDGFLFEKDTYYKQEPLYFTTESLRAHFTFKYPDADDGDIIEGDENFNFIYDYMNRVEESVLKLEYDALSTEYLSLIDVESFAKWFLEVEITGNFDPNIFYVLKNRESLLQMYPIWDSEWSLGLYDMNWGVDIPDLPHYMNWEDKYLFKYLLNSPVFKEKVKEQWNKFKPHINEIEEKIDNDIQAIEYAQIKNWELWPIAGKRNLLVKYETWEEEVEYVRNYFTERISFLDTYIPQL